MSGLGRAIADLELRNAATMRAAQEHYDNLAPEDFDETELTEQEAREQAADELSANPATLMFHLGHLIGDDAQTASADALYGREWVPDSASAGTLLAVMFEGSPANRDIARAELRDRLAARMLADIAERADDLMRAQERERNRYIADGQAERGLDEQMERGA